MLEVKDVSGKILEVGDEVAFCIGGSGTVMRVGVINKITEKSVILGVVDARHTYNEATRRYDKVVLVEAKVIRAHDSVSKIFEGE